MSILKSNSANLASLIRDEMIRRGYDIYTTISGEEIFNFPGSILHIHLLDGSYKVNVFVRDHTTPERRICEKFVIISSVALLDMFESYAKMGISSKYNLSDYWSLGEKLIQTSESEFKK